MTSTRLRKNNSVITHENIFSKNSQHVKVLIESISGIKHPLGLSVFKKRIINALDEESLPFFECANIQTLKGKDEGLPPIPPIDLQQEFVDGIWNSFFIPVFVRCATITPKIFCIVLDAVGDCMRTQEDKFYSPSEKVVIKRCRRIKNIVEYKIRDSKRNKREPLNGFINSYIRMFKTYNDLFILADFGRSLPILSQRSDPEELDKFYSRIATNHNRTRDFSLENQVRDTVRSLLRANSVVEESMRGKEIQQRDPINWAQSSYTRMRTTGLGPLEVDHKGDPKIRYEESVVHSFYKTPVSKHPSYNVSGCIEKKKSEGGVYEYYRQKVIQNLPKVTKNGQKVNSENGEVEQTEYQSPDLSSLDNKNLKNLWKQEVQKEMMENEVDYTKPFTIRPTTINERGGKVRIVGVTYALNNTILTDAMDKSIEILKGIPGIAEGFFLHSESEEQRKNGMNQLLSRIGKEIKKDHYIVENDFSEATDHINLDYAQIIMEELCNHLNVDPIVRKYAYRSISKDVDDRNFMVEAGHKLDAPVSVVVPTRVNPVYNNYRDEFISCSTDPFYIVQMPNAVNAQDDDEYLQSLKKLITDNPSYKKRSSNKMIDYRFNKGSKTIVLTKADYEREARNIDAMNRNSLQPNSFLMRQVDIPLINFAKTIYKHSYVNGQPETKFKYELNVIQKIPPFTGEMNEIRHINYAEELRLWEKYRILPERYDLTGDIHPHSPFLIYAIKNGTQMGFKLSFVVLCLLHKCATLLSGGDATACIFGDDLIANWDDNTLMRYNQITSKFGFINNADKTYRSKRTGLFCGVYFNFVRHTSIRRVEWKMIASRKTGFKSLVDPILELKEINNSIVVQSKSRKQQRRISDIVKLLNPSQVNFVAKRQPLHIPEIYGGFGLLPYTRNYDRRSSALRIKVNQMDDKTFYHYNAAIESAYSTSYKLGDLRNAERKIHEDFSPFLSKKKSAAEPKIKVYSRERAIREILLSRGHIQKGYIPIDADYTSVYDVCKADSRFVLLNKKHKIAKLVYQRYSMPESYPLYEGDDEYKPLDGQSNSMFHRVSKPKQYVTVKTKINTSVPIRVFRHLAEETVQHTIHYTEYKDEFQFFDDEDRGKEINRPYSQERLYEDYHYESRTYNGPRIVSYKTKTMEEVDQDFVGIVLKYRVSDDDYDESLSTLTEGVQTLLQYEVNPERVKIKSHYKTYLECHTAYINTMAAYQINLRQKHIRKKKFNSKPREVSKFFMSLEGKRLIRLITNSKNHHLESYLQSLLDYSDEENRLKRLFKINPSDEGWNILDEDFPALRT